MVPAFTMCRSTREMPSFVPAASPRLRRRLSPWPPHRHNQPASELTSPRGTGHALHTGPYPPDLSRPHAYGTSTTGSLSLHLLVLLAGPGPSGSTDPSRRCRGRLPPSPAFPGSGCPQLLSDRCAGPTVKVSHLHSITWRLVAHDRLVGHLHPRIVGMVLFQSPPRSAPARSHPATFPRPRHAIDHSPPTSVSSAGLSASRTVVVRRGLGSRPGRRFG